MKLSKLAFTAMCALALTFTACGDAATETAKTNAPSGDKAPAAQTKTATIKTSTPSEANESLFNAIKNKDKRQSSNCCQKIRWKF